MNCDETRRHWNLYHDSEGDATLHFEVNEHLAACPKCAKWFYQQSRLEELLAAKLGQVQPTPDLWSKVLETSGVVRRRASRRWIVFAGVAACAATLLLAALVPTVIRSANRTDLEGLATARHTRLRDGAEEPAFRSQSDLDVEDYLRQRVTFPVRCPPRKDAGFAVQGAGTCELGEQSAAYLFGQVDQAPVSIFVLSRDSLSAFPRQMEAVRDTAIWRSHHGPCSIVLGLIDKNLVLVIGEARAERLERVLNAYGTYHDDHHG